MKYAHTTTRDRFLRNFFRSKHLLCPSVCAFLFFCCFFAPEHTPPRFPPHSNKRREKREKTDTFYSLSFFSFLSLVLLLLRRRRRVIREQRRQNARSFFVEYEKKRSIDSFRRIHPEAAGKTQNWTTRTTTKKTFYITRV